MAPFIDLTGKRFGSLVAIRKIGRMKGTGTMWECQCDCGNVIQRAKRHLKEDRACSCGCRMEVVPGGVRKDMIGWRSGRLTVLKEAGRTNNGQVAWECLCDCGKTIVVAGYSLRAKVTKSCGCYALEAPRKGPGEAGFNRVYTSYRSNASRHSKGISFCLSKEQFRELTKKDCYYCGIEPSQRSVDKSHTKEGIENSLYVYNGVDRINSSKGYTVDNCVPCCEICNKAKRTLSLDEFREWALRFAKVFLGLGGLAQSANQDQSVLATGNSDVANI